LIVRKDDNFSENFLSEISDEVFIDDYNLLKTISSNDLKKGFISGNWNHILTYKHSKDL